MNRVRLLLLLAAVPFISGWFCISIPTSIFDTANACVSDSAYVGQRINNTNTGKVGTVRTLHGRSERCQTAIHPIKATLDYE